MDIVRFRSYPKRNAPAVGNAALPERMGAAISAAAIRARDGRRSGLPPITDRAEHEDSRVPH